MAGSELGPWYCCDWVGNCLNFGGEGKCFLPQQYCHHCLVDGRGFDPGFSMHTMPVAAYSPGPPWAAPDI